VRRRLPSRRGATEQPNATGDGDAVLTVRFWVALALTGVATGLVSIALMALLFRVEHLAFGYSSGDLESGVLRADDVRRVVSVLTAGAVGGIAWYVLRRLTPGERSDLDDVLWSRSGRLSMRRSAISSVISEVVIGMGASLGREAAPKLMGGVSGQAVAEWFGLTAAQRRLLVACGGGAGLACVYNVPLGGALFTAEILCGAVTIATILPALACCGIATVVGWLYLPTGATYVGVPSYPFAPAILVWSLLVGPLLGVAAAGYIRLIGVLSSHRPTGWKSLMAPLIGFAPLAVAGIWYPQLFGNGKDMAHDVFLSGGSVGLLLALGMLKPLVTATCLGSGASGGLFTPVMSTGAVLGGGLGALWTSVWHGGAVGAYALVGAAATIGAAMQAPLTGLVLAVELTHSGFGVMSAAVLATVLASAAVRYIDGYSIYTARLPAKTVPTRRGNRTPSKPDG
jgi:CIC family chloride channel protein